MTRREEEKTARALAEINRSLDAAAKEKIRKDAEALLALQDTQEDLSVLPTLARSDIPPTIRTVAETGRGANFPSSFYEAPTSGIFYHSAVFGMEMLPAELIPLVPFFCHAATKMGTARRNYAEMATLIDRVTGGVGFGATARTEVGTERCIAFLHLESKCLDRNQAAMFDILTELTGAFSFADLDRLRQLLLEYRTGYESMVLHNGHRLATSLASRNFSPQAGLSEIWGGVSQLQYLKKITETLDEDALSGIAASLTLLAQTLWVRGNARCAHIGEAQALTAGAVFDSAFDAALGISAISFNPATAFNAPGYPVENMLPREGWYTSSSVSFVSEAFKVVPMTHPDAPALAVIARMLRSLYIHREVREKGGAYGGYSSYHAEDGIFSFSSYRDPQIASTLKAFQGAAAFIAGDNFNDEDINEALLQVCSDMDRPDPPGPSARKAFGRKLVGLSDDMRRTFKESLLSLTRDRVREVAGKYFTAPSMLGVAVISGKEQLEAANTVLESPLILKGI